MRPSRPASPLSDTGAATLSRDERSQRPLLAHPLRHANRLLAGLDGADPDLVADLPPIGRDRGQVDGESGGRQGPPHALGLIPLLERANLDGPVGALARSAGLRSASGLSYQ